MPQLDLYIALSQVFWFTLVFITFYVFMVRDILPELARSIKLRKKKVGGEGNSDSVLDQEISEVSSQTNSTLENSLNDSRTLLSNVATSSSSWLETSLTEVNEKTLLDLNKNYIKTIGELKGRSYLLEQTIKQK
jgi:F0F1-type ATP synthase membrane subunit b/b'